MASEGKTYSGTLPVKESERGRWPLLTEEIKCVRLGLGSQDKKLENLLMKGGEKCLGKQ